MEIFKEIPDKSIDLIITDPPYLIEKTNPYSETELGRSIQPMFNELKDNKLNKGFNEKILDEMMRVMKKPNLYIWCNVKQIPQYIKYFCIDRDCKVEFIIWHKPNAMPLFNNKYLTDKEYCLYFKKSGYCQPENYQAAKTVYEIPINIKDKKKYGHPTIKPLEIIENLVRNSSHEGDIILDPFIGSGTTAVASIKNNRQYIGMELNEEYYKIALKRIREIENKV